MLLLSTLTSGEIAKIISSFLDPFFLPAVAMKGLLHKQLNVSMGFVISLLHTDQNR